jgi:SAM-dependent methyltransferase
VTTAFDRYERQHWAGKADAYHRSFAGLCAYPVPALLRAAGVGAAAKVLDVGTGPGTVAALAGADRAAVVALDAEPSMLALAGHNAPAATLLQAALPQLPFPDHHFDAAVANFVLNHVGDPFAAVVELGRVVRHGGRVAVTVWPKLLPLQQVWEQILTAGGLELPSTVPGVAPDKDFQRSADGVVDLLLRAGLTDVSCQSITWTYEVDAEDCWTGPASGIGTIGYLLTSLPPDAVERIRRRFDEFMSAYRTPRGLLALPAAALLASGRVALTNRPG